MFEHYINAVKNYAVFEGRATRPQYWYFILFSMIISIALGIIEVALGWGDEDGGILTGLYSLFILVPSIAVGVRRIHDSNKSGWWILLPFYNLYLLIRKGTDGENRFGPNPNGGMSAPAAAPVAETETPAEPAAEASEAPSETPESTETK